MTLVDVAKDFDALTMTMTAEFDASSERVWELWSDPRKLERWWGPPTYPATVDAHDLRPGGRVAYHMTGPQGDQPRGYWDVVEVDPPRRLVFRDGFADANGEPSPELPVSTITATLEQMSDGRTRMVLQTRFPDAAAMERILAMGAEEGMTEAVGQIDAILAEA